MKEFRKDINGLRCIAVLAVLFYHFDIPGITGGYIGVDVFFVISGYLMTDIILSRLETNNFSLADFWLSRARRIFPALFVLLLAVLAFGWFRLSSYYYLMIAKYAAASMLFVSNIVFNNDIDDYFGEPAHENWLLHTWSLSVEWQFYIIYPLVLLAVARMFKSSRTIHATLLLWFLVSLGYCLFKTPVTPSSAFYLLSTRTWEFLAGACVYLLPHKIKVAAGTNRMLESAGLMFIIASVVIFQEDTAWPGYNAIIPVLGTALVIAAGNRNARWSNNSIVEYIGKWSYSIYLWHWPVVVGLRYFEYLTNALIAGGALLSSILIGGLSYHWIENPVRTRKWGRMQGTRYALAAVFCIVIPGWLIIHNKGVPDRLSKISSAVATVEQEIETGPLGDCESKIYKFSECALGNKLNITAAVWGDSHAQATIPGITKAAEQYRQGVLYYSLPGCPPIFGAKSVHKNKERVHECISFNENVFHRLQPRNDISVILVSRFSSFSDTFYAGDIIPDTPEERGRLFQDNLITSLCAIAAEKKVYVLKPIPEMTVNVPKHMLKSMLSNRVPDEIYITYDDYKKQNSAVLPALETAKNKCGINLLDPVPYLCKNNKCYGALNGRPLYSDSNHLSNYGNQVLLPLFSSIFN